jgi:N-acetylglucosamine-6-phosphate deacetylase
VPFLRTAGLLLVPIFAERRVFLECGGLTPLCGVSPLLVGHVEQPFTWSSPARLGRFAISILLFSPFLFSCSHPRQPVLAITHITVIDMTGAAPLADQTVIIEKQRVSDLGPSNAVTIPRGAQILDAHGKFLIPGLVDMHIHLTAAGEPDGSRKFIIPLLLANGVTSVRDMGSYLESILPLRKEIEEGKRIGPGIITPGPYLDGSPPSFQPSLVVTTRAQADEAVHQLVSRGVDFIKVQSVLSRDAYFAVAQAAEREHIVFVGHVPDRITAAKAADAGQRSIEHLTNVLRGCSRDEPKLIREQFAVPPKTETPSQSQARISRWQREILDSYSPEKASALISKFKQKDVWQTPTLILLKNDAFPTLENSAMSDDRAKFTPSRTLDSWKQSRTEQMKIVSPQESELHAQLLSKSMDLVSQMQKAGVRLLAGTDSPAPYVFPGSSLHDELQLLVEAGLTPFESLQAATKSPTEFLHSDKDSGTIEKGKFADIVILDANPLEDIRNTRKVRAVILHGKLLDRPTLDQLLDSIRSFASAN